MTAPAFDIPGYKLVRELGAGGMATVFLAVQTSLERRVAIKVMRRGLSDENVEKRFLLEGRTMARLPHPNIVGVYDIVQNETINYIAMEFLDGGMLSDRMRDGLTLAEAISIVVQVAGALQFAHDNGIVHRDLKPANIMFRDPATPVLTDFGIARQQDPAATRLTQTGMMIGTPTYMSPEQATGGEIDGRSDQYALGVLFYEMLTGHPPFEGDSPIQVVLAHLNTPPPTLPPQFAFFQAIMDRLLAKDREARYPDLRTFTRELKTLLTASDALAHRLQIDSNQSASEQLRALGFSESQIHTGAARISGVSPRITGSARSPRTGSGPGVRMGNEPGPERPRWLWPAVGAGVLLVAVLAGWLLFGGSSSLDPALQNIVDRDLAAVDALIQQNKLVAPEGDNAFERLQEVLQVAPGYPEAQRRLDEITTALRTRAEEALQAKRFDVAETRIAEALAVAPQDAAVLAVQKRIQTARLGAERDKRITELLAGATAARKAGKLFGDDGDNALALLRQARDIDPEHAATKAALAELAGEILKPVSASLQAGKFDEAERLLDASESFLASEPAWQALQKELEQGRNRVAQQQRIDSLLAEAQRRLTAGRIAEPAGDNALESLARIAEIDPANPKAAELAGKAGEALVAKARAAEKGGEPTTALTLYDQALQAVPGKSEWVAARSALEQRLGAQQQQLARALADANTAITERRYYAPAGKSARDALDTALKLDPNNATAKKLSADLPTLAREAAQALADEGRVDAALGVLAEIIKRHPDDRASTALTAKLTAERERLANSARRDTSLAELRDLLSRRQLNPQIAGQISAKIAELQKLDINDAEALRGREFFLKGLGRAMAQAHDSAQLQTLEAVLAAVEKELGAKSPDLAQLRRDYEALLVAVRKEEQEKLAALAGLLVLNAAPWANVESVVDQGTGKAVTLPADRSTPLRLTVPPGTYRVTFRHPEVSGPPVVRVVVLQPKGSERATATFATLTTSEYLRRAGYAP